MSYEGRIQALCSKGHLTTFDCMDTEEKCECGEEFVFENPVDDTNCDDYGYINFDLHLLINPSENCTCDKGFQHKSKKAIYKIPSKKQIEELRTARIATFDEQGRPVRKTIMYLKSKKAETVPWCW